MRDRRRSPGPQDRTPAAAEDGCGRCRARPSAPGRTRWSPQSGRAVRALQAGTETGSAGTPRQRRPRVWSAGISLHDLERTRPARLVKEVEDHLPEQEVPALLPTAPQVLVRRRNERPVDEHRPSDYILLRDESPEAAVIADVTIVAHRKVVIRRHNNVFALDELWQ